MVFQEHGVFPWMNVIDNVAFGLEMQGVPRKERYTQSMDFLKRVGLSKYAFRNPYELSVGMRQRIAIARAFVTNPAILLMDEPFGSLDAQTRLILQEELLKIWSEHKKTVIFVTHDIDEAILLGDRLLVMTSVPGRIKEIIAIGIDRPRDSRMESTPEFIMRLRIWNSIRSEVEKAMQEDTGDAEN
jgi:NitT/TauT family transport system ATP-binding protein